MKIILPLVCLDFYTEGLLLRPPAGGQAATVFQHEELLED